MPPRRRYDRCPYSGCTATGGNPWLSDRHVPLVHVRCCCGWVGALNGLNKHAGQINRHRRAAGLRPSRHVRVSTLPLPEGVS
jgi:hypothetical protein